MGGTASSLLAGIDNLKDKAIFMPFLFSGLRLSELRSSTSTPFRSGPSNFPLASHCPRAREKYWERK
jgi:hypothetical protein